MKTQKKEHTRKRGKRSAEIPGAEPDAPPVSDESIAALHRHLEREVAPRILAGVSRRLGAQGARPRDYRCNCDLSYLDGLPICCGVKPDCRYAGRLTEAEIAAHTSDAAHARYMIVYRAAMDALPPVKLPAKLRRQ
ncbi:hypothetical protein [Hyphococcus sp.]|uniref:hypothetical protein n=1 Tax=Hyphococcus sp. TaxID=2038636 RepID=UPI003CCBF421